MRSGSTKRKLLVLFQNNSIRLGEMSQRKKTIPVDK